MTARRLEGRPVADAIWARVKADAEAFAAAHGRPPALAMLRGDDGAAQAYARQIERSFGRNGLAARVVDAPGDQAGVEAALRELSADREVDGVLVLTPLPNNVAATAVVHALDPAKDVDGIHPESAGRLAQRLTSFVPSTALGGLRLMQHYEVPLRGARVAVVGRSPVVGLPLTLLLVQADATVTVCHTRTQDLPGVTREADVVCVAAGRAGLIGPDAIRPDAVVVDFGTNVAEDGSLVGDVQPSVAEVAGALTPVPGGTGPVTVAVLAEQTVQAARLLRSGG